MIFLVYDRCMWPRTHPGSPVTHQNVSRVLGRALKILATIVTLKTIVHGVNKCLSHCVSHCVNQCLSHCVSHCVNQCVSHCVSHCVNKCLSQCLSHCVNQCVSQCVSHCVSQCVNHHLICDSKAYPRRLIRRAWTLLS